MAEQLAAAFIGSPLANPADLYPDVVAAASRQTRNNRHNSTRVGTPRRTPMIGQSRPTDTTGMGLFRRDRFGGSVDLRWTRRHPPGRIECELGRLVDLSVGGMRLELPAKHKIERGQVYRLKLRGLGSIVPVRARVVWHDMPMGLERFYKAGFEFLDNGQVAGELLKLLVWKAKRL